MIDMARSTAGREVGDAARRLDPSPPLSAAARAPRTVRGRRQKASLFEATYFDRRRGARQAGGRRGSAGPDAVRPAAASRRALTASYFSGAARRSVTRSPRFTASRHGLLRAWPRRVAGARSARAESSPTSISRPSPPTARSRRTARRHGPGGTSLGQSRRSRRQEETVTPREAVPSRSRARIVWAAPILAKPGSGLKLMDTPSNSPRLTFDIPVLRNPHAGCALKVIARTLICLAWTVIRPRSCLGL